MTVALLAVGLDSGVGMFHADIDRRPSLALDVIEAVRPYVDCWLIAYLASSVFANRDFTELSDGEVRITHPLNSHLAHTAVVWRKACEPVAGWLAQALDRTAGVGAVLTADDRMIPVSQHLPTLLLEQSHLFPPLAPPLPAFLAPKGAWLPAFRRAARLNEDPVPRACAECGKALPSGRRKFCTDGCAASYHTETPWKTIVVATAIRYADPEHSRVTKLAIGKAAARNAERRLEWRSRLKGATINEEALRRWYNDAVFPALSRYKLRTIMECTGLSKQSAILIRSGRRIPHLLHVSALAKLAGIEPPRGLLPAPAAAGAESHLERRR
jgi:hypothetical protein